MARSRRIVGMLRGSFQGALTASLCVGLLSPWSVSAQQGPVPQVSRSPRGEKLTGQQRVVHALNRFTFGPRPGDVDAVSRMGLDAWFEQQLHPERIADGALDGRLARFPAMQLSAAELIAHFPPPQLLRQYEAGRVEAPHDAIDQAIYADAAFGYKQKQDAAKNAQAMAAVSGTDDANAAMPADASGPKLEGKRRKQAEPMDDQAVEQILALPPDQRVQRLASLSPQDMAELQAAVRGPQQFRLIQGMSPVQMEQVAAMQGPVRVVGAEAVSERLLRDVYSERQLQAVMTDFWLNHFNVYIRKNQNEPYLLPAYERQTVLPHALGRFEDLLVATAQSPAMLVYLDNATSIGPHSRAAERLDNFTARRGDTPLGKLAAKMPKGINENYARELMELHTLGVKGGYTQQDVIEVAKCFTGWTVERPGQGGQGGEFVFNPNRHEPGPKTVLGHKIPEGGENEGLAVLHILATSPSTAHFLSLKLAQRFVSDTPPPALVDRMAAAYLRSDGDISTVLRTMFHSPEFWSPDVYRAKVKTPIEFVASALRASGADVKNPLPLMQAMTRLGMPIYGMQTPNGYSWQSDAWVSSSALLTRMNFALVLSAGRLPGTSIDWNADLGTLGAGAADPGAAEENRLESLLLDGPVSPQTRAAVTKGAQDPSVVPNAEQGFRNAPMPVADDEEGMGNRRGGWMRVGRVGDAGPTTPLATMAGLLLGSPEFQRR